MASGVRIRLSHSERQALIRQRRRSRSRRVVLRITAVLMLAAGIAISHILETLGISRRTLQYWKQRWLKRRQFGLEDAARSGRPPEVNVLFVRHMIGAARRDPRTFGFAFTRWTAPRLCEYLFEVTGVLVTPAWVTELLRTHGFVWRRTKRTTRNLQNRTAKKRAQKALRRLKKGYWIPAPTMNSGSRMACVSSSCRW